MQTSTLDRRSRLSVRILGVESSLNFIVVLRKTKRKLVNLSPLRSGASALTSVLLTGTLSCTMFPIEPAFFLIAVSCSIAFVPIAAISLSNSTFWALSSSAFSLACIARLSQPDGTSRGERVEQLTFIFAPISFCNALTCFLSCCSWKEARSISSIHISSHERKER